MVKMLNEPIEPGISAAGTIAMNVSLTKEGASNPDCLNSEWFWSMITSKIWDILVQLRTDTTNKPISKARHLL